MKSDAKIGDNASPRESAGGTALDPLVIPYSSSVEVPALKHHDLSTTLSPDAFLQLI